MTTTAPQSRIPAEPISSAPKLLEIVIFVMPWEIDDYGRITDALKVSGFGLTSRERVRLHVSLCISEDLFDWSRARLPKSYFVDRFNYINAKNDWTSASRFRVEDSSSILGSCAKRRQQIAEAEPDSCVMWLDPDMVFPPHSLRTVFDAAGTIADRYFILTPQTCKMWDESWDPLVHDDFRRQPYGDCFQHDVYALAAKPAPGALVMHGAQKIQMGGGWMVTFSSELLKLVRIPDSFGPYGKDDDVVVLACRKLKALGFPISQYMLESLVVAPDFKYRNRNPYFDYIPLRFDKDEMARQNRALLQEEVEKIVLRVLEQGSLSLWQRSLLRWSNHKS